MPIWVLVLTLAAICYAAACRYGVNSRNGRYWRAHTPGGDLVAIRRTLVRVAGDLRELDERQALLERPWEEEFLHWARDERGWHLHGHLAPPPRRRTKSVTSRGWCPGLAANSHEANRRAMLLANREPTV